MKEVNAPRLYRERIALVSTVPFVFVTNLDQQIRYLHEAGLDITLVSSDGPEIEDIHYDASLRHKKINIERNPSTIKDLITLYRLFKLFRKEHYTIVHSTTPKAGLLCAIAAKLAGIAIRLHTFTGQRWVTMSGPMRNVAKYSDWVIARINTRCYADSQSQANYLVSQNIGRKNGISVIGNGSLSGIDMQKFDPARIDREKMEGERERLFSERATVIIFLGRIHRDKGVRELVAAFLEIAKTLKVELLLVGPMELGDDDKDVRLKETIQSSKTIHYLGYKSNPAYYLAMSDLLCLPSYREGFGTVIMEAASMGIPAVGTSISGLVDAIVDGETGVLVPPRDSKALANALSMLVADPVKRAAMGAAARERCRKEFDYRYVNGCLVKEYTRLLDVQKNADVGSRV